MSKFGTVLPASVTVTAGKSTFTAINAIVNRGISVEIVREEADGWAYIKTPDGKEGFVLLQHLSLTNTPLPTPEFKPYQVEIIAVDARLRSGAGDSFSVVGHAPMGQKLNVVGQTGDWLHIKAGLATVYIAAHHTRAISSVHDNEVQGFLIERPDLMTADLVPSRLIPTEGLEKGKRPFAAAKVWNEYGGLLERLADRFKIPVATMVAVVAAESSGKAFGADGRLTIRFEVHIFHSRWGTRNQDLFSRHFKFESWRNHQWRADTTSDWQAVHTSQEREHQVLDFARKLDDTAGLMSISMGLGQVMGFNFKLLGYESVQEMFETMSKSANAQILGMFDFVTGTNASSPAIQALQSGDLLGFATIYNGAGNAPTYEAIMQEYIAIYQQLMLSAQDTPRASTQRGPADDAKKDKKTVELVEALSVPPPTSLAPLSTPSTPVALTPQSETLAQTTQEVNIREQANKTAKVLGTAPRGASFKILEPLESALTKMKQAESAQQFVNIQTADGKSAFIAAWLLTPAVQLTPEGVLAYFDKLPAPELPAGYQALWAQQTRLGLPDPFDMPPVAIRSESELVNMQVNGYGPNTFAFWNWQKWYSRVGGMHNGYDFIVKTGTPLLAVSDGVIIKGWTFMANPAEKTLVLWCFLPDRPEYRDAQGRRMMSNVLVAYGHMSNNSLRQHLEVVKAGDVIGLGGTPAGTSTNDHLHYEVHLLSGDPNLPNGRTPRKLLKEYDRPQPLDNNTPWNPLLFYSPRLIAYSQHQGQTIGFLGKYPEYPTLDMLKQRNISHLPAMTPLTLAYYRYGIQVIWNKPKGGGAWQDGIVPTELLEERLKTFADFVPYPASFLKI